MTIPGYDLIGDIHGHSEPLTHLLCKLGYKHLSRRPTHPEGRKVIFLGDYIDRGPAIRETLEIVRAMVEEDVAIAILGNHEINALRFHTIGSKGTPLRPHTTGNIHQHQATLEQFPNLKEWRSWMRWLAGLPLFVEVDGFRAVHASWDDTAISHLAAAGRMEDATLEEHTREDGPASRFLSRTVNGPEGLLPHGCGHHTEDGVLRREFRVKWWLDLSQATCREAVFPDNEALPD